MVLNNENLIKLRQEFHQFPELGFHEHETEEKLSRI